ncbi:reverse transcriptase family protein, partial [Klebsiella pneumoniae]|uniref:reverse transcriptase family protein n=1 Tax=Klebsiella pneumoniae TaxID=573 RepID=UPI0040553746
DGAEKYRIVVDFRQLNENTCDETYPIPRFEDILDRLSGATTFSTLDLKAGYHQIQMHPPDQHKTAFSFERGHYEFMPGNIFFSVLIKIDR